MRAMSRVESVAMVIVGVVLATIGVCLLLSLADLVRIGEDAFLTAVKAVVGVVMAQCGVIFCICPFVRNKSRQERIAELEAKLKTELELEYGKESAEEFEREQGQRRMEKEYLDHRRELEETEILRKHEAKYPSNW